MRRRAGRGRPGERVSVDRARHRHRVRRMGHAGRRQGDDAVDASRTSSSAATRRSARRTSSGPSRTATRPRSRSTSCCSGEDVPRAPGADVNLMSQKMGIHEWSYDNDDLAGPALQGAVARHEDRRCKTSRSKSSSASTPKTALRRSAALPQLRRADGVHAEALHRVRRVRRHLPDGLHHVHRERRRSGAAHALTAPALNLDAGPVCLGRAQDRAASW